MGAERELSNLKMDKSLYRLHSLGLKGPGLRRRRPRPRPRAGLVFLGVALTAVLVFILGRTMNTTPVYAVKVGDEVVGYTETENIHKAIVDRLLETEGQATGTEVVLDCEVVSERLERPPKGLVLSDDEELAEAICNKVAARQGICHPGRRSRHRSLELRGRGQRSPGRSQGQLHSRDFGFQPKVVEEVFIKENVSLEPKNVPTSMFRNREEAVGSWPGHGQSDELRGQEEIPSGPSPMPTALRLKRS